jgi:hypothetical protein
MRNIFFILIALSLFLTSGCSKKEDVKLKASGGNAFAIDMGGSWDVQALTELHGFAQNKKDDKYIASIFYTIDVITTSGRSLKSLFTKQVDKKESEKMSGINLEAEFNLDESYPPGDYKVVFNIKDLLSNKTLQDTTKLKLEK